MAPREGAGFDLSSSALEDEAPPSSRASIEQAEAMTGRLLSGRYLVHELIGQGGMGNVYRGEQVHLRKQVAIKLLSPNARKLPELVARFEREAVAGAHIRHPNVVSALDFGQLEDRSYFLVLEYVEGTPLRKVMAKGPMPALRALRIARQIAAALHATHERGIVHRDVKPQNILVDENDHAWLIDFGFAKVDLALLSSRSRADSNPDPTITTAGEIFGTLAYLAPESARGMDMVDARADLYALGVVLYELLCGRQPYEAKDLASLFNDQRVKAPPSVRERAPELHVPPEVEPLVMRLIQIDLAQRYATAVDAIRAIDETITAIELAEAASRPLDPLAERRLRLAEQRRAQTARLRWLPIVAVVALLVIGGVALILLTRA